MAWTAPRTWNPGEAVTASWLNTHLRDNLILLKTFINNSGVPLLSPYMDGTARTGSGTAETDATSFSLPANTLATNGMILHISIWGKTAAGASTRTIKLYWNGASILTTTTVVASGIWIMDAMIMRTGAAAQTARVSFGAVTLGLNVATPATVPQIGTVWDTGAPVNATLSGAVTVKTTLQDSAAGTNVTQLGFSCELVTST